MTEQQKLFDMLRAGVTPFACVKENCQMFL